MRYTNIPKDKRNDVITMHIVEQTEKVKHFYTVAGLSKKHSVEAVESDGYYEADEKWVNIEPMDGYSEYGSYTKPKISETKHYIPCSNYGKTLTKQLDESKGWPSVIKHRCHDIMLIPKHVLDESGQKYVPTNHIAWIRDNPICRQCRRRIKAGLTLEVAE